METGIWNCEICGKLVVRLLGMAGLYQSVAGTQVKVVLRGYCAAHRADVEAAFRVELESLGEVEWIGEPAAEVKPRDAGEWLFDVDNRLSLPARGQYGFAMSPAGHCPHCAGRVQWGAGPHVADALVRPGAEAWHCLDCGAAGIGFIP